MIAFSFWIVVVGPKVRYLWPRQLRSSGRALHLGIFNIIRNFKIGTDHIVDVLAVLFQNRLRFTLVDN